MSPGYYRIKTVNEKLVRDKIPKIARRRGDTSGYRTAELGEMPALLRKKLTEQCEELLAADPDTIPDRVAEVVEVALAFSTRAGYTEQFIEAVRQRKLQQQGGFNQRRVLRTD